MGDIVNIVSVASTSQDHNLVSNLGWVSLGEQINFSRSLDQFSWDTWSIFHGDLINFPWRPDHFSWEIWSIFHGRSDQFFWDMKSIFLGDQINTSGSLGDQISFPGRLDQFAWETRSILLGEKIHFSGRFGDQINFPRSDQLFLADQIIFSNLPQCEKEPMLTGWQARLPSTVRPWLTVPEVLGLNSHSVIFFNSWPQGSSVNPVI